MTTEQLDKLLDQRDAFKTAMKQYEDEIREIDAELLKAYAEECARCGELLDGISGTRFYVRRVSQTRRTLDRMLLLNYISSDDIAQCEKVSESTFIRCFPVKGAENVDVGESS